MNRAAPKQHTLSSPCDVALKTGLSKSTHAHVWRGHCGTHGPVIVKLAPQSDSETPVDARLLSELKLLNALKSPCIVAPLGVVHLNGSTGIVLEDIDGQDLTHPGMMELSEAEVYQVGIQVAQGLQALQASRVVHGRLSLNHIVFCRDTGRAQLIGLGGATEGRTIRQEFKWAPESTSHHYMAPEQTGRVNRPIDNRSDLYVLGLVLFELMAGHQPYSELSGVELLHAQIATPSPNLEGTLRQNGEVVSKELAAVIQLLLEKDPNDRYQSAYGVLADLEALQSNSSGNMSSSSFSPGQKDYQPYLKFPHEIIGRAREVSTLTEAFRQVQNGDRVVTLISGRSGVGKTALVRELYKPLAASHGDFVSGKFDQLKHDRPRSAVLQALSQRCRHLLALPDDLLETWRQRLRELLGQGTQILVSFLPELANVLECSVPTRPQPSVGLSRLLCRLITSLASAEHPLVLFIDDLQWADEASTTLLHELMCEPTARFVHLVLAFRSDEVPTDHPLSSMTKAWKEAGTKVQCLSLGELSPRDVNQIASCALRLPAHKTKALSDFVHSRTLGNAFFVRELFELLSEQGLIRFDQSTGAWTWRLDEIRARRVTGNVVSLVGARLDKLTPEVFELLQGIACLGSRVPIGILAVALKEPPDRVLDLAEIAEHNGLINVSHSSNTRQGNFDSCFLSFAHDRIQQAALATLSEAALKQLHLRMGRNLVSLLSKSTTDSHLFLVLGQLNSATTKLVNPTERYQLAKLNTRGAKRALEGGALEAALTYANMAESLLGQEPWTQAYELTLETYSLRAEVFAGTGNLKRLEKVIDQIECGVREPVHAARGWCALVRTHTNHGVASEGVAVGTRALKLIGINLEAMSEETFSAIELNNLSEMVNPRAQAAIRLLASMGSGAYVGARDVFPSIVTTMTSLLRRYGTSPFAAPGLAWTTTLFLAERRYQEAYLWGRSAVELIGRYDSKELECQTLFLTAISSSVAKTPLRDNAEEFHRLAQMASETGNFDFVGWSAMAALQTFALSGRKLSEIAVRVPALLQLAQVSPAALGIAHIWAQVIDNLSGRVEEPSELNGRYIEWRQLEKNLRDSRFETALSTLATSRMVVALFAGNHEKARSIADDTEHLREGELGTGGFLVRAFFASAARLFSVSTGAGQAEFETVKIAVRDLEELRLWSKTAPESALHKVKLLEAELARTNGNGSDALTLYDQASEQASKAGYAQDAALALKRAAALQASLGRIGFSRTVADLGAQQYQAWSACDSKTIALTEPPSSIGARHKFESAIWDIESVAKASRALSRQLERPELIQALTRIALENAGAQHGAYISATDDVRVESHGSVIDGQIVVSPGAGDHGVCWGAINYVRRTGQELVIATAKLSDFETDPHVRKHKVGAMLCLPVVNSGKNIGILYMENNSVEGAFTEARIEILTILTAQLAVSLENVSLYENLHQTIVRLENSNRELEDFAHIASHDLREPLRTMGSYAELLQLECSEQLDADGKEFVDWIIKGSIRMTSLLNDILTYTRAGEHQGEKSVLSLGELCTEVCENLSHAINAAGAEVTWSDLPSIRARRSDLYLILQNLIGNGIKFRSADPPRVNIWCQIGAEENVLCVDDNGIGLKPEFRKAIFERFRRLHARDEFEGNGLGLAICQRLANRMGGSIWCESSEAGGASLRLAIPHVAK